MPEQLPPRTRHENPPAEVRPDRAGIAGWLAVIAAMVCVLGLSGPGQINGATLLGLVLLAWGLHLIERAALEGGGGS